MKMKSLLVFVSAAAMPFAAALGQNNSRPSGPQGTGWYSNSAPYGDSMPSFEALDRNGDGVLTRDEYPPQQPSGQDDRLPYSGFSADTNPPSPPQ